MIVKVFNPVTQLANVHRSQFGDILSVEPELQCLTIQASATTIGTRRSREKLPRPLLGSAGGGVVLLHLDILDQPVKGEEVIARGERFGAKAQPLVSAIHDVVQGLFRQLVQRRVKRTSILFTDSRYLPENLHILVFAQRQDATVADAHRRVRNDFVAIDEIDIAQSLTTRTGAKRRVEREIVWSGLHIGQARNGIHERTAVIAQLIGLGIKYHQLSVALLEGDVHGIGQTLAVLFGNLQPVHNKFHAVIHIAVQLHAKGDFLQHAVNTHIDIPLLAQVLKQVLVVALAVLDQRRQDVDAVPLIALHNQRQYFVDGVFHHLLTRQVGISVGGTGIQQPQVVIHLGRRAYRTARVAVHGLLPYRDDGTQTGYLIHVGALKHPHHVTGIGRERFQVTALPLGKHRVKGQRGLAASTQTSHHGQLVMRNLHVDVLEVMDTRAQDLHAIYFLPVQFHALQFSVNHPILVIYREGALATVQVTLFGHPHLVGLAAGIGQLGGTYPRIGFTQLGIGNTFTLGPINPAGNRPCDINRSIGHRLVKVFAREAVAIALGRLHDQLVGDNAEHITRGFLNQIQVEGVIHLLLCQFVTKFLHASIIARRNSRPMAIFLISCLEVLASGYGGLLGVIALIYLVAHFQTEVAACASKQLPHASRLGAGISVIVHRTLGDSQVEEVEGHALFLQYLGQGGKIAVGSLETQFRCCLAIDDARQLAVQPLGHIQAVKVHFLPCKSHTRGDIGACSRAEHGRCRARLAVLALELAMHCG